jgi:hypothetical protein
VGHDDLDALARYQRAWRVIDDLREHGPTTIAGLVGRGVLRDEWPNVRARRTAIRHYLRLARQLGHVHRRLGPGPPVWAATPCDAWQPPALPEPDRSPGSVVHAIEAARARLRARTPRVEA